MSEPPPRPDWQWSAEVSGIVSSENEAPPRAFLWIPPECAEVRTIVIAQQATAETAILEHPDFRVALRDLGFAAIWIAPPFDLGFDAAGGAGAAFDTMLAALAAESGYDELTRVPVVPLGHSAAASFPWNFARWAPERTLAVISVSGQWPTPLDDPEAALEPEPFPPGIPGLVTLGEYEWADEHAAIGLKQRAAYPQLPLTFLAEAGAGHFDVSDEKIRYLALYLRKAAAARLPSLPTLDPEAEGWLVDRWRREDLPRVPPAPVAEYAEPEEAFWCFDEEHALATEKFRADQHGKRVALLGYVQEGAVIPQVAGTHQQVTIPFRALGDDLTFKLVGTFLDTVPKGRPERWTGLKEGATIPRPASSVPVAIDRLCGPVRKLAPDTFALRFGRADFAGKGRSAEIWFVATHPGDAQFRRSVQQAVLRFPLHNREGAAQTIAFAPIPDQPVTTRTLPLTAASSAGATVHFYVREGPAEIGADGASLVFTPIPLRAKFPVQVTVVAWQWGRPLEPKLQTAEPVERAFFLTR
jgi:hypothetical protein